MLKLKARTKVRSPQVGTFLQHGDTPVLVDHVESFGAVLGIVFPNGSFAIVYRGPGESWTLSDRATFVAARAVAMPDGERVA